MLVPLVQTEPKCKKRSKKHSPEDSAVIPLDNLSERRVEYGGGKTLDIYAKEC